MKYLFYGFVLFLSSTTLYGSEGDDTLKVGVDSTYAHHALYLGLMAPFNSLWSYGYDCRLIKNMVVRIGISYIPLSEDGMREKAIQYGIFPAYLSGGKWATELGAGVYYDAIYDKVNVVGNFGVRYQDGNHGIFFRAGLYPNLGNISDFRKASTLYLLVSFGFNIGYAF